MTKNITKNQVVIMMILAFVITFISAMFFFDWLAMINLANLPLQ